MTRKGKNTKQVVGKLFLEHKESPAVQRYQVINLNSEWRKGSLLSRGMKLTIEEPKVTAKDKALAKAEAEWAEATPRKDGSPRNVVDQEWAAKGYALARTLTEMGATHVSMKAAASPRVKSPATWCSRANVPAGTVARLFEAKPAAPQRNFDYSNLQQRQPQQDVAFYSQEKVAPDGTKAETLLKLIEAGLTPEQALKVVGLD